MFACSNRAQRHSTSWLTQFLSHSETAPAPLHPKMKSTCSLSSADVHVSVSDFQPHSKVDCFHFSCVVISRPNPPVYFSKYSLRIEPEKWKSCQCTEVLLAILSNIWTFSKSHCFCLVTLLLIGLRNSWWVLKDETGCTTHEYKFLSDLFFITLEIVTIKSLVSPADHRWRWWSIQPITLLYFA